MSADWDRLLKAAWQGARARHLYPELPDPEVMEDDGSIARSWTGGCAATDWKADNAAWKEVLGSVLPLP